MCQFLPCTKKKYVLGNVHLFPQIFFSQSSYASKIKSKYRFNM